MTEENPPADAARDPVPPWLAGILSEMHAITGQDVVRMGFLAQLTDETAVLLKIRRVSREQGDAWLELVTRAKAKGSETEAGIKP